MNRNDAIKIARDYALIDGLSGKSQHYLPKTKEQSEVFNPHCWVVDAILHAGTKTSEEVFPELSTKEINTRIAKAVNPESLVFDNDGFPMIHNPYINEYFDLNYCGDWNLLMPLVIANHIGFDPLPNNGGDATCWSNVSAIKTTDKNHQLALAKCVMFLIEEKIINDSEVNQ